MENISVENYKKILVIMLLFIVLAGTVFPAIYFLKEFKNEQKFEYLIFPFIASPFAFIIVRFILKVFKNFTTIHYFKIHDTKFEYLRIPYQTTVTRGYIWDRIKAIYFKPEYNTKLFNNIVKFESINYNQIGILLTDRTFLKLPLVMPADKTIEVVKKLNNKLVTFKNASNVKLT